MCTIILQLRAPHSRVLPTETPANVYRRGVYTSQRAFRHCTARGDGVREASDRMRQRRSTRVHRARYDGIFMRADGAWFCGSYGKARGRFHDAAQRDGEGGAATRRRALFADTTRRQHRGDYQTAVFLITRTHIHIRAYMCKWASVYSLSLSLFLSAPANFALESCNKYITNTEIYVYRRRCITLFS